MDTLAGVNVFNLDNLALRRPTGLMDGMHAESEIANEPQHPELSHSALPFSVAKQAGSPSDLGTSAERLQAFAIVRCQTGLLMDARLALRRSS